MPRVVFFEIPAKDPAKVADFYKNVFGWEINKWEGPFDYWLITTGEDEEPGINGGIMTTDMGQMVRNTIGVDSIDDYMKKIENAGGKMVTEKMEIKGIGIMAAFVDTEGNISVIMEPAPM